MLGVMIHILFDVQSISIVTQMVLEMNPPNSFGKIQLTSIHDRAEAPTSMPIRKTRMIQGFMGTVSKLGWYKNSVPFLKTKRASKMSMTLARVFAFHQEHCIGGQPLPTSWGLGLWLSGKVLRVCGRFPYTTGDKGVLEETL